MEPRMDPRPEQDTVNPYTMQSERLYASAVNYQASFSFYHQEVWTSAQPWAAILVAGGRRGQVAVAGLITMVDTAESVLVTAHFNDSTEPAAW